MKFVLLPSGSFMMDSPENEPVNENNGVTYTIDRIITK